MDQQNYSLELLTGGVIVLSIYALMYFVFYKFLKATSSKFREVDYDRRMYIVKNYVKSLILGVGCYRSIMQVWYILWDHDSLNEYNTKMNAIMYFVTDTAGLLLVRGLPANTKMHHIATNLLGFYVVLSSHRTVCSAYIPVLYACFSSLAFSVNFYLAFRAQRPNSNKRKILSKLSYWIYAVTSVVNWFIQMLYIPMVMINGEYIFPLLYTGCLYVIIKDDIILMRWLRDDFEKQSKKSDVDVTAASNKNN
jgi:hypothetical protein